MNVIYRQYLHDFVRQKRALDARHGHTPPAPFRGWHERGYLPHYDAPGAIQMLTFRLNDAMPAARRSEWEALRAIENERERRTQLEAYLDRGYGACHLGRPQIGELVEQALLHFDARRYRLIAWVVMPNHVHVLCELWLVPLDEVLHNWKRRSALAANRLLGLNGRFWQPEYWDRYMRDREHAIKALHYIESNPVKAGLVRTPDEWPFSSANPKWHWAMKEGQTRLRGGHLMHENWKDGPQPERSAGLDAD